MSDLKVHVEGETEFARADRYLRHIWRIEEQLKAKDLEVARLREGLEKCSHEMCVKNHYVFKCNCPRCSALNHKDNPSSKCIGCKGPSHSEDCPEWNMCL